MLSVPDFTFTRLAHLCVAIASEPGGTADLEVVDTALNLDSWSRETVLDEAAVRGFITRPEANAVALAERGRKLAAELQEGLGSAENRWTSFAPRSFTTYMPRGDEELAGGRS